jgi:hypothetical protein
MMFSVGTTDSKSRRMYSVETGSCLNRKQWVLKSAVKCHLHRKNGIFAVIWYAFGAVEPSARQWRGSVVPAECLELWAVSARAANGVAIHDPTAHFFQKLPRLAVLSAHQRTRDRL